MTDKQKIKKALELLEDVMLEGEASEEAQKAIEDSIYAIENAIDLM